MNQVRLFPSGRLVAHKLSHALGFQALAIGAYARGQTLVAVAVALWSVVFLHDLGWVTVTPGKLVRWRITGRSTAITPLAISVETDMMRRRFLRYIKLSYFYPILTLADGQAVRLPLGSGSRERTAKQVILIRKALAVPEAGTVEVPKLGKLGRILTGSE